MSKKFLFATKKKKRRPLPFIWTLFLSITFFAIFVLSFFLAQRWHLAEEGTSIDLGALLSSRDTSSTTPQSTAAESPSTSYQIIMSDIFTESGAQTTAPSTMYTQPENKTVLITKSSTVDMSYFDDAVFIGDSISQGLFLYDIVGNATVLADKGVNIETIFTKQCIKDSSGNMVTVLDALENAECSKIYIMLGANGIAWMSPELIVENYSRFIGSVRELHPNATIYIQSILPMTAEKSKDPKYANSKIDDYNKEIFKMAEAEGVYYINVAEALKNEHGALPDEASPTDGMHFTPKYYRLWLEYLTNHVIEEDIPPETTELPEEQIES